MKIVIIYAIVVLVNTGNKCYLENNHWLQKSQSGDLCKFVKKKK